MHVPQLLRFSGPLPKNIPEAKNSPRKAKTHARMFAHILAPKLHFEIWWALLLVKNSSSNNNIILIIQSYQSSFNSTVILFYYNIHSIIFIIMKQQASTPSSIIGQSNNTVASSTSAPIDNEERLTILRQIRSTSVYVCSKSEKANIIHSILTKETKLIEWTDCIDKKQVPVFHMHTSNSSINLIQNQKLQ